MSHQDTGTYGIDKEKSAGNGSDKKNGRPFRKRYSWLDPPPSIDAAIERIDDLESGIISVETQLEYAEMPHMSDEAYECWRKRAMRVLCNMEKELDFVNRWLAAWRAVDEEGAEIEIEGDSPFARAILVVKTTADDVRKAYETTRPGKRTKARKAAVEDPIARLKQLRHWQATLESSIRDLKGWAKMCRMKPEKADIFKTPAVEVLGLLQIEILEIEARKKNIAVRSKLA